MEKLPGTGHLANGTMNPEETQKRTRAEEFWMTKPQTNFPYGLDERFKNIDFRNRKETDYTTRNYFNKLNKQSIRNKEASKYQRINADQKKFSIPFTTYVNAIKMIICFVQPAH